VRRVMWAAAATILRTMLGMGLGDGAVWERGGWIVLRDGSLLGGSLVGRAVLVRGRRVGGGVRGGSGSERCLEGMGIGKGKVL
jgi:hypothetical protein